MAVDVIDILRPKNSGAFPIVDTNEALGGYHVVANDAARDAITSSRRRAGMRVYVTSTDVTYIMHADLVSWIVEVMPRDIASAEAGTITVSVAIGGSNTPTATRPAQLKAGIYAAAFATIEGALACIPKGTGRAVINIGAGNFQGATVESFTGGTVELVGTWATPTLTSGVTSGTCGAGSGATIVNKPTGSPDWTLNQLRGKYFCPTNGAAYFGDDPRYEAAYLIASNTGSQLVLTESAYAVDATTTFAIRTQGTFLTSPATDTLPAAQNPIAYYFGALNCLSDVQLVRVDIDTTANPSAYGLVSEQSQYIDLLRCSFGNAFVVPGYSSNLRIVGCYLENSYLYAYGQSVVNVLSLMTDNSAIVFEHAQIISITALLSKGDIGYASALAISHVVSCTLGGDVSNGAAVPVVLKNIHNFDIAGTLTGTNATPANGMTIEGGGYYNLAGASIAGAAAGTAVLLEGTIPLSWAQISGNATITEKGTFLNWGSGMLVYPGSGIVVSGQIQIYGFIRPQGEAHRELTAQSNGGVTPAYPGGDAYRVGYMSTIIAAAVADYDSIRLFSSTAHAGDALVTGGMTGRVVNAKIYIIDLYPPTGGRIFFGGTLLAVNEPLELTPGVSLAWQTSSTGVWYVS